MRPVASVLRVAACLSSLAPLTAAWPGWLPEQDALVVRADDDKKDATSTPTPTKAGAKSHTAAKTADLNTAKPKKTGTAKGTATGTGKHKTDAPHHTTFAPDAPAGSVSMITPNTVLQPTPLFKISDDVTFSWNYTNLLGKPTAVDVFVSCSKADATWTLTANMSFETSVNYVWDSSKQADDSDQPLLTEMYTLIVKDSDAEITDTPDPGYLGSYSGFQFGMYKKQPYSKLKDWDCPGGCGGAAALFNNGVVPMAVTMSMLTVLSFTWFVAGLGLH